MNERKGADETVLWTLHKDDHVVAAIVRAVHAEMEVRLERDGTTVQLRLFDAQPAMDAWLAKRRQDLLAAGWSEAAAT